MIRKNTPVGRCVAFIAGLVILALGGCTKEDELPERSVKITGTVYYDCKHEPFANQPLELVHATSTTANFFSEGIHTITDANGHFEITYTNTAADGYFTDEYQLFVADNKGGQKMLVSRIPGIGNVNLGDLYVAQKVRLFVDIQSSSPNDLKVKLNDTLYFGIGSDRYHYITPVTPTSGYYEFDAPPVIYAVHQSVSLGNFYFAIGWDSYREQFMASEMNLYAPSIIREEFRYTTDCLLQDLVDTVRIHL